MSQLSRVTLLPEHEARALIQKCYLHGRKVRYIDGRPEFEPRAFGTVIGV